MMLRLARGAAAALTLAATLSLAAPAAAVVHYGDTAPDFMKTQYNTMPPITLTVNSYAFKVRVFFLLGFN